MKWNQQKNIQQDENKIESLQQTVDDRCENRKSKRKQNAHIMHMYQRKIEGIVFSVAQNTYYIECKYRDRLGFMWMESKMPSWCYKTKWDMGASVNIILQHTNTQC